MINKRSKSEYKFNIEIFKDRGSKEISITNASINDIRFIVDELYNKYG